MLRRTLILYLLILQWHAPVLAQPAQVTPAPIRVVAQTIQTRDIDLLHFDFQKLYSGFEGLNYTAMKGEPSAGAQLYARAQLFRPEAVTNARFALVDAAGRELNALLFFSKRNNDVLDGDFDGLVDVPTVPFKVRVTGIDGTGKPYQRTYPRLFKPIKRQPATAPGPMGLSEDQIARFERKLAAYEAETRKHLTDKSRQNPDGVITLPRAEVSEATYEPLLSSGGNVIGLRINYALRVSHDGKYAFSPSIWPLYEDQNSRGKVEMHAIAVDVNPLPEGLTVATAALLLRGGAPVTYRAGQTYHFTVYTIPNFAIQNVQKTRFCIMRERFKGSPELEATWRSIVMRDRTVSYGTSIGWTTFTGTIDSFSGPGVFYQSLLKEGAKECSPGGNVNF